MPVIQAGSDTRLLHDLVNDTMKIWFKTTVEVVFIMVLHVVVVVRGLAAAVGVHHWGAGLGAQFLRRQIGLEGVQI